MNTYLIQEKTIKDIAGNIRTLNNTTDDLTLEDINNAIIAEKEYVDLALEAIAKKGMEIPEGRKHPRQRR